MSKNIIYKPRENSSGNVGVLVALICGLIILIFVVAILAYRNSKFKQHQREIAAHKIKEGEESIEVSRVQRKHEENLGIPSEGSEADIARNETK